MTTTVPVGTTPDDYISSSELDHVLLVYTDGCCRGNSTAVACPTGWGVTIVRPCPQSSSTSGRVSIQSLESDASKCEIVDELCGPVVLDSACPYYLCASVGSNNTAELSGVGEALLWLVRYIRNTNIAERAKMKVYIRYDSEYAAKSVLGIFNGKKNVEMIEKIRSIYRQVKSVINVSFLHVKGHSGHIYNDRVDKLANRGATMTSGMGGRYYDTAVIDTQPVVQTPAVEASPAANEDVVRSSDLPSVLFLYTDGCCIGNNTQHSCPTGWGVIATRPTAEAMAAQSNSHRIDVKGLESDTSKCEKIDELHGPVILDPSSPFYLGATVGSNNTGELTGIGEALLWVLAYARTLHQQDSSSSKQSVRRLRVFIRYDSEYAAKSVQGIFNGKKNVELIEKIRLILRKVKNVVGSVTFLHVKGHSGHLYNDRADELAKQGSAMTSGSGRRYTEGDAFNIDITGLEKDTSGAVSQSESIAQTLDSSIKEAKGKVSHRSGTGVELSSGNHDYLAERARIPTKPVLSLFKSSSGSGHTGQSNINIVLRTTAMTPTTATPTSGVKRPLESTPADGTTAAKRSSCVLSSRGGSTGSRNAVIDLTETENNNSGTVAAVIKSHSTTRNVITLVDSDDEKEDEEDQLVFLSEDEEED